VTLNSSVVGQGETEVTVDSVITVLTGPADGWSTDTRFIYRITEQPDGFLRVREMREVLKLEPGRSSVEASWGGVKNLYR
ncbi:MAG TPA: hypothetical protein VKU85_10555, partial [bacterium]|nr:hypothetical protein [bacterium]